MLIYRHYYVALLYTMKTLTNLLLILTLPVFLFANENAEKTVYTIITKNDTAGYLHVSTWEEMDTVFYSYYSDATTTLLKTFHVVSERICKYIDGQLIYSHSENIVNGDLRDKAITAWKGSHYEIINGDEQSVEADIIDFSSLLLFFSEPQNIEKTYSELKAKFLGLNKEAENAYRIDTGWGRHSTYFYESGMLKRAEISIPLITFELIRQ